MDKKIYQEVECISNRENPSYKDPMVGIHYYLDLASIYIDSDGDAYGMILTTDKDNIGYYLLKHFKSLWV